MVALHEQGKSLQQIGQAVGRARSTVRKHLTGRVEIRPHGVHIGGHTRRLPDDEIRRIGLLYEQDKSPAEIGAQLGLRTAAVRVRVRRAGLSRSRRDAQRARRPDDKRWTAPEVETEIVAAYRASEEVSVAQVAEQCGVCTRTVARVLRDNDVPIRGRGPKPKPTAADREPVPVGPILSVVEEEISRLESEQEGSAAKRVCHELDISERLLYGWRKGIIRTTKLSIANRVLLMRDLLWFDIYDASELSDEALGLWR